MSQLLNILNGALDGIDVDGAVGGEAGNLLTLANTVAQLTQGQPPSLGDFVTTIAEMELPDFDFAGDLTSQITRIRDLVPTGMADILNPITQAMSNIDSSLEGGVTDIIEPLVNAFRAIQTLLHNNFALNTEGSGSGGGGPAATPASSIVSGNPDTQIDPAKLQTFQNVLDELPAEPSVAGLLQWFNAAITIGRDDMVMLAVRSISFLDDVRAPLNTVLSWQALSPADFQNQINATLQTLSQAITAQTGTWMTGQLQELASSAQILNLTQLRQIVLDIIVQLQALSDHIDADTLTGTILTTIESDVAGLVAQRNTLAQQFTGVVQQQLDLHLKQIALLPDRLQEKMSALILLLQPPASFTQSGQGSTFPPATPPIPGFSGLDTFLDRYLESFENLMSALDISDITDAFAEPAKAINQAVTEIDEAITMVTMEITSRLNQVQSLIAAVNLTGIVDTAEQAIEEYTTAITGTLSVAFGGVRQAIEGIATQISAVVNSFNPAAVVSGIEQGIDAVGAALQAPEITALLEVAEKLKSIAQRLDQLSFAPIADSVVGTIDDMKSAVQGLGSSLDDPLKGMLRSAIDVLPDDLTPVTDPLVAGLGELLAAGPIPLLEAIKDAPQQIVDVLNNFDPATLIGDSLSAPFQELITEIEAFEPATLFHPVAAEIENFKQRLRDNVRPGDLLDPLIRMHDQILLDLDGFTPGDIIAPVNDALTQAVARITDSIPVTDIFDEIQSVIDDIERILGTGGVADSILQFIGRLRDYLVPFVNATDAIAEQLHSWLNDILSGVVDAIDVGNLQTAFDTLGVAIDTTRAEALQTLYNSSVAPLQIAVCDTLQPRALMTELVRSHGQTRTKCNQMTDVALKSRVDALLVGVNPSAPQFTEVFTAYGRVMTVLDGARQRLLTTLSSWDQQFHGEGGVLMAYRQHPASAQQLKQWLIDSLELQLIRPLQAIFEKFAPAGRLLDGFLSPLVELVNGLRETVNKIIAAPAALLAVGESLEGMRERLQQINLNFIGDSINAIFDTVKQQLRGLDPRGLKSALNESFDELLDAISLEQIVPVDALNQTDNDLDQALEALRQLDPQILITEVIQPKFEEILAPFISALDLSPALNALTERLRPLEDELGAEMDRVNQAYQGFLNAVPA